MRTLKRVLYATGAVILGLGGLTACSGANDGPAADGKLKIVTTTTQLDDFAKNVTEGTDAEVVSLFQPGASVHSFEPSASDLEEIRNADVVIYNGMGLESWLDETLNSANFKGQKIDASEGFDSAAMLEESDHDHDHVHEGEGEDAHAHEGEDAHDHAGEATEDAHAHEGEHAHDDSATEDAHATDEHDHQGEEGHDHDHEGEEGHDHHHHDGPNPHIWTSPEGAEVMVHNVGEGLAKADEAHGDIYKKNADAYVEKLHSLDKWITENIDQIPVDKRVVASGHEALDYYNARYEITSVGSIMPSWDDNAEPSAADIDALVAKIKEAKVPAIFSESQLSPAAAEAIAKEANVKVYSGDEGLFTDSLGAAGSDADTYIKSTIHNTKQLMDSWGKPASAAPADLENA